MDGRGWVESTSDPAFAVNDESRVVAWNRAAESAFGYPATKVLGKLCCEVLDGRDLFLNEYCSPSCPLIRMAREHVAVHRCVLMFRHADGELLRTEVSSLTIPDGGSSDPLILHLLKVESDGEPEDLPMPGRSYLRRATGQLTPRESEVLTLLGEGLSTEGMARNLGVSIATVRNHVEHILGKLEVHSRAEAVSLAFRSGLLR